MPLMMMTDGNKLSTTTTTAKNTSFLPELLQKFMTHDTQKKQGADEHNHQGVEQVLIETLKSTIEQTKIPQLQDQLSAADQR